MKPRSSKTWKITSRKEQRCLAFAHQWLMVLLLKHRMAQGVCPVGRSWHSLTPISSDHLFLFGGFTTDKQPLSKSFQKDFVFVFLNRSLNFCLVTLKSLYIPSTSCDPIPCGQELSWQSQSHWVCADSAIYRAQAALKTYHMQIAISKSFAVLHLSSY